MKQIILLIGLIVLNKCSFGQNIYSSAPDSVYNFDHYMSWWGSGGPNGEENFVSALDSIDNLSIFTEVCSGAGSDTLFFGHFEFQPVHIENSAVYLEITKRKSGSEIRDAYLAVTYNGHIISDNLADTLSFWTENDSTSTYFLDSTSLQITLDNAILNDSTFGFIFSTSSADPFCMNAFINAIRLNIEENITTSNQSTVLEGIETTGIAIFPNPTTHQIHIKSKYANLTGTVTNLKGETVQQGMVSDKIDVSDVPAGIYFLEVFNAHERIVKKIVKK